MIRVSRCKSVLLIWAIGWVGILYGQNATSSMASNSLAIAQLLEKAEINLGANPGLSLRQSFEVLSLINQKSNNFPQKDDYRFRALIISGDAYLGLGSLRKAKRQYVLAEDIASSSLTLAEQKIVVSRLKELKQSRMAWLNNVTGIVDSVKLGETLREGSYKVDRMAQERVAAAHVKANNYEKAIERYLYVAKLDLTHRDTLHAAKMYTYAAETANKWGNTDVANRYFAVVGELLPSTRVDVPEIVAVEVPAKLPPPRVELPDKFPVLHAPLEPEVTGASFKRASNPSGSPAIDPYAELRAELSRYREDSFVAALLIRQTSQQIDSLEQVQVIKQLEIARKAEELKREQERKRTLLLGLGLALLLLGMSLYFWLTKRKAHKDLQVTYKELAETHQQLKSAQLKLVEQEKMASLGQLTAGIAHEINNPINFISGNISPLRRDLEDIQHLLEQYQEAVKGGELEQQFASLNESADLEFVLEEIRDLLFGIEEGTVRTTEIIKGLRNFSRLDESSLKDFDIHQGLDSTLVLLNNKLKDRVTVEKSYGELPLLEGFPGKINQVLMNVLNNAIQAIPSDEKGHIQLTTRQLEEEIEVEIQDSGKGIPEEQIGKIFDPFFTTKEVGEGTGLGLSISKGIMEQHQGDIFVKSEEGTGTTITLRLPIKQQEAIS
ncbi:MAG: ATP-binding protein [Bacteroidota bacterium]